MKGKSKVNKNPLYVVTNKGKVVEEANSAWEVIVKTLGLDPFLGALNELFSILCEMARSLTVVREIEEFLGEIIERVQEFQKKWSPV